VEHDIDENDISEQWEPLQCPPMSPVNNHQDQEKAFMANPKCTLKWQSIQKKELLSLLINQTGRG
jgi:hypothetical protein